VVVGKKVVVFHRVGKQELVEALDAASGQRLWKAEFEARYRNGYDKDLGPRCVPLVQDGKVYVFGAAGDLHCMALADGTAADDVMEAIMRSLSAMAAAS